MALKKIYQNDLEELKTLISRMQREIETYSHVSEYLPKSLMKELESFDEKILHELERRESIIMKEYMDNIGDM